MISFEEALALVLAEARPLGTERVRLDAAMGRRLAEPIVAALDSPRRDVSAMDGYAVRDADLGGAPLRVVGEAFPGNGYSGEVSAGGCVRIFTGAPVPEGCDRIVIQEIVERDGDLARVVGETGARFVRTRGMDFRTGEELVPAGRIIGARILVAAAGADCGVLTVWRRASVATLATGDELAAPGEASAIGGAIPDSVTVGIAGMVAEWGAETVRRERSCDDRDLISRAGAEALAVADVVVVTGGASVGEKDFAKASFADLGLELIVSNCAIRPGKPVWFGRLRDTLVLGLPGNPTSAMVTARLLLAPLLAALGGGDAGEALRWRRERLAGALPPCDARATFVRARATAEGALPLGNQDSSAQKTLADADLLIRRRPHAPAVAAGETVEVIDF